MTTRAKKRELSARIPAAFLVQFSDRSKEHPFDSNVNSMSLKVIDTFQADFCAARLKALGEPIRLRIIDLLRGGEMTVTDLAAALETAIVTASHHLQILKNLDFVVARREGKFIYYGLPKELLQKRGKSRQLLNLGCCLIEVPMDGAPAAPASQSE